MKSSHQSSFIWQKNNHKCSMMLDDKTLLLQVLENLQDGILIISATGEIVHANTQGKQICLEFNHHQENYLPPEIWQLCQSMLDTNRELLADNRMIIDELSINHQEILRICVRALAIPSYPLVYFLVIIENRSEAVKNIAIAEVKQFDLTPREAEIWHLYRTNHTYKNIASQLYITVNTVKKHMKNIHAKRQAFMARRQL